MVRYIFNQLKGWQPVDLVLKGSQGADDAFGSVISGIVGRLMVDEPIQYIFGNADFYGFNLKVTRDTLIPRPETAELVDWIVVDYRDRKDLSVLDVGTGSGCIAIALSRNLPFAEVTGVDVSSAALNVAKENASNLRARVRFQQLDILIADAPNFDTDGNRYDIIVSNPPYIAAHERATMENNVLDFEPHTALFVPDSNPLLFYKAILHIARRILAVDGKVYFEINPIYVSELRQLGHSLGFQNAELRKDSYGKPRFLKFWR